MKYAVIPLVVEVLLILLALRAAQSIPEGGDPTLRYVSVGIPAFWAVVLAALMGTAMVILRGQSVSLGQNAFVFRRGKFSVIVRWSEAMYRPSSEAGGRSFGVSSKNSQILVLRLLYPEFDRIEADVVDYMKRRAAAQEIIQV